MTFNVKKESIQEVSYQGQGLETILNCCFKFPYIDDNMPVSKAHKPSKQNNKNTFSTLINISKSQQSDISRTSNWIHKDKLKKPRVFTIIFQITTRLM